MAPTAKKVQVSQQAFDSMVKENVEEFSMDLEEALADALKTLELQGVDLRGIITDGSGGAVVEGHPVLEPIRNIQTTLLSALGEDSMRTSDLVEYCENSKVKEVSLSLKQEVDISEYLRALREMCLEDKGKNAPIAERNEGVEVVLCAVKLLKASGASSLANALAALTAVLTDNKREQFARCGGPQTIAETLSGEHASPEVVSEAANALAKSALQNEDIKDAYMQLKVHETVIEQLKKYDDNSGVIDAVTSALRSLVTADDDRIAASRTFQNGMLIAKAGAMDTLLETAKKQDKHNPILGTLCLAMKDLAVNDDICKSMAANGGLSLITDILETCIRERSNRLLARTACILLTRLSGSDANKDAFARLDGLELLVTLIGVYSSDPSIVQEAFTAVSVLTLRSPSNASQAVNVGIVDITVDIMETFKNEGTLQRQACQMLRNLSVRNPENRPIILEKGLERLIRQAKAHHFVCKDAASAALRDLGFNDYNV